MRALRIGVLVATCCWAALAAIAQQTRDGGLDPSLKKYLQTYLGGQEPAGESRTRVAIARVRLSGGSKGEIVVYVMGPNYCGSGGCTVLVLEPDDSSYKVITKMTVTRLPIRVLATRSNGWRDLGVMVRGGGIAQEY